MRGDDEQQLGVLSYAHVIDLEGGGHNAPMPSMN
jgi:hypothetical protein